MPAPQFSTKNTHPELKIPIPNQKKVASTQNMQSSTQDLVSGTVPISKKVVLTAYPGVLIYPTRGAGWVSGVLISKNLGGITRMLVGMAKTPNTVTAPWLFSYDLRLTTYDYSCFLTKHGLN